MSPSPNECRQLSENAFELTKPLLPVKDAEEIRAYIYDHNEWGLGIETLAACLLEDEIPVSWQQKHAITAAMKAMGLKGNYSKIEVFS